MSSPTTRKYLLRVEAVNFDHFIFDTNDLSTIRGGGLLLLRAISAVGKGLEDTFTSLRVKAISTGASIGLFAFNCDSEEGIALATQAAWTVLHAPPFAYATFVVNAIADTGAFRRDAETLVALNRHQQMISASFSAQGLDATGIPSNDICSIDLVRPAATGGHSASVSARREYGREKKRAFYKEELAELAKETPGEFTEAARFAGEVITSLKHREGALAQDLGEIARDVSQGNANDKIAVFYADGNSFSRFQRVDKEGDLTAWDTNIKRLRRTLLSHIVDRFLPTKAEGEVIRLETLLWGGDEMIFVVPAWRGLELAQLFFEKTQGWTHNGKTDGTPLTHATGLVICHHNAPIHPVVNLAHVLGDQVKQHKGRAINAINCVVLESFDHIGSDWEGYLKRIYNGQLTAQARCLTASQFDVLLEHLPTLEATLPKSRLYPYLHALIASTLPPEDRTNSIDKARKRFMHDAVGDEKAITAIEGFDPPLAGWSLVADLWDFRPLPPKAVGVQQTVNTEVAV
jgi:hypothetical protein